MLKIIITPETFEGVVQMTGDPEIAREWCGLYKLAAEEQLAEALIDQLGVSIANSKSEHRPMDGLGQCRLRMSQKLSEWLHQYAPGHVYDEAFITRLVKDNQHLCLRPAYLKKAQIIVAKPQPPAVIVAKPMGAPVIKARLPEPAKAGTTILGNQNPERAEARTTNQETRATSSLISQTTPS